MYVVTNLIPCELGVTARGVSVPREGVCVCVCVGVGMCVCKAKLDRPHFTAGLDRRGTPTGGIGRGLCAVFGGGMILHKL